MVASVAAVIKLKAVGRAGSSVSLMSVCSVCSAVLPCGRLLRRRPTMDEVCPLVAFVLLRRVNHRPVNSTTPQPNRN